MIIYALPLLVGVITFSVVAVNQTSQRSNLVRQADAELHRYRTFVSTADQYFKDLAAPTVTTAYTWEQIKTAAPTAIADGGMNQQWKAVRAPDGTWSACTQLSEVTLSKLAKLFPAPAEGEGLSTVQRVGAGELTSQGGPGSALGLNDPAAAPSGVVGVGGKTLAVVAANLCDAV